MRNGSGKSVLLQWALAFWHGLFSAGALLQRTSLREKSIPASFGCWRECLSRMLEAQRKCVFPVKLLFFLICKFMQI